MSQSANDDYATYARRRREPARLRKIRPYLLERAGWRCQICEFDVPEILVVHHIIPMKYFLFPFDPNHESNLIAICPNCHAYVHTLTRYGRSARIAGVNVGSDLSWPANRNFLMQRLNLSAESAERMLLVATEWAEFGDGGIRLMDKANNRYRFGLTVRQATTVDLVPVTI